MSLFTVEQVELVRRLKRTGITIDQVAEAFESLDRLDHEFDRPSRSFQSNGSMASNNTGVIFPTPPVHALMQQAMANLGTSTSQNVSPPADLGFQDQVPHVLHAQKLRLLPKADDAVSNGHGFSPDASAPVHPVPSFTATTVPNWTTWLDSHDLQDFLTLDDEVAVEAIRSFVSQHNLRQLTVAQMTGISQPYVSKFLRGEAKDISQRVKISMYSWYLACRKNPQLMEELFPEIPSTRRLSGDAAQAGLLNGGQRRERFIFRPVHTSILERYFGMDAYPSPEKRDEITQACNNALRTMRGGLLDRKETVYPQIIANWFANRRKEERKRDGTLQGTCNRRGRRPYFHRDDSSPYSFAMHTPASKFSKDTYPSMVGLCAPFSVGGATDDNSDSNSGGAMFDEADHNGDTEVGSPGSHMAGPSSADVKHEHEDVEATAFE